MDNRVKEIEELIKLISKFPGLGPKSARRVALHLLKNKNTIVKPLSQSLTDVYNKVVRCLICGNMFSKIVFEVVLVKRSYKFFRFKIFFNS